MKINIKQSMILLSLLILISLTFSFKLDFDFEAQNLSNNQTIEERDVESSPVAYNQTKAKQYAYVSMITHCTDSQITNWNCQICKNVTLTDISLVQNATYDIAGFVGYYKSLNQIVVSWRGTVDMKNWEVDFRYKQTKYAPRSGNCTDCAIHTGIYQAYRSVETQVNNHVKNLLAKYPSASITSTGHSLGGGLSLLTSLQLSIQFPTKLTYTYNYGCLRIGNGPFVKFLKSKVPTIYRVVHNKDPVPHLPPYDFGYIHPANQVLYGEDMKNYVVCDDSGQDKNCSNKYVPYLDPNDHTFYFVKTDSSVC